MADVPQFNSEDERQGWMIGKLLDIETNLTNHLKHHQATELVLASAVLSLVIALILIAIK